MGAQAANKKREWTCPKCGREFASRSAYHGCGNYSVEGYLAGKNPAALALFNSLAAVAKKFPDVTLRAAKTQITFRVRANFLMVAVSGRGIQGYIALPRAVPKPYFKKIVAHSTRRHGHLFRIDDPRSLNDFIQLLPEAIAMFSGTENEAEAQPEKKSPRKKLGIGHEINSLYRAERRA
jgi:hypothetical protein